MILNTNGKPIDDFQNRGEVLPHVLSFAAIWNNISKIYSYRWDEALRHQPENALAMRRDCYIRSLLQERAMPTVNRRWQIAAEDPRDPVQKATARTLTAIVQRTPRWKRLLKYLLEATWYGRYGAQVIWRQRPVQGRQRWCIVRHRPVNGDKIQYRWDGMPAVFINTTARNQYPDESILGTDRNPVLLLAKSEWRRQFIIHQHEIDDADYFEGEMAGAVEGVGLRSMIYWAWWLRDEMLSWAVDFMKKVGSCGFWVFPYEEGSKAGKVAAERNAREAGHAAALTMPVVIDGRGNRSNEPIHVAGETSGIDALQHMISNYFERHIERLVVGQSMSSGGGGPGGLEGDGRAEFAEDTKFQLLHYDADNLAETLTEDLLGPAMHFNFPQFDFRMRWEFIVEDPDKKEKIEAIKTFGPMGLRFRENEVRELTGMSEPEDGDKVFGGNLQQPDGAASRGASAAPSGEERSPPEQDDDETPYRETELPEFYGVGHEFDERLHPRDRDGQFVSKGEIAEAAYNPEVAKKLRAKLSTANQRKLDSAIEAEKHPDNKWQHAGRDPNGAHRWEHVKTKEVRRGRCPDETHKGASGLLNPTRRQRASSAYESRKEFEEAAPWEWNLKQRTQALRGVRKSTKLGRAFKAECIVSLFSGCPLIAHKGHNVHDQGPSRAPPFDQISEDHGTIIDTKTQQGDILKVKRGTALNQLRKWRELGKTGRHAVPYQIVQTHEGWYVVPGIPLTDVRLKEPIRPEQFDASQPGRPIRLFPMASVRTEEDLRKITEAFKRVRGVVETPKNRRTIMAKMNERHKKKIADQTKEMLADDFERDVMIEEIAADDQAFQKLVASDEAIEKLAASDEAIKKLAANKNAARKLRALLGIEASQSDESK